MKNLMPLVINLRNSVLLAIFILLFSFLIPSSVYAWTNTEGGDHNGEDWIIDTNTTIDGIHTNIGLFQVNEGVTVSLTDWNGTTYGQLQIEAESVSVLGTINGYAKGYLGCPTNVGRGSGEISGAGGGPGAWYDGGGGGGGHGGKGGESWNNTGLHVNGGISNGSLTDPITRGGGGGGGNNQCCGRKGGDGGGAVKIVSTGTCTISGTINVNGEHATSYGGGGAGGSINLRCNNFEGAGILTANGGNGAKYGGGGGGGRIALVYSESPFGGTTSLNYGTNGSSSRNAENGTLHIAGLPSNPFSLGQYRANGSTILDTGEIAGETSIILKFSMRHATASTEITPKIEVQELGVSFTNTATHTGSTVTYEDEDIVASIPLDNLNDSTDYHWQAQLCDSTSNCSSWVSYGDNLEDEADFSVLLNTAPNNPTDLTEEIPASEGWNSSNTPTFTFNLTDPDESDQVKYQILIDNDSDFSSPIVNYTSDFEEEGLRTFTVGQEANGGTYTTGSSSQTLADGIYYWKVKAFDDSDEESQFAVANSSQIAFKVDATIPTGSIYINLDAVSTPSTGVSLTISSSDLLSGVINMKICNNEAFLGCEWEIYQTSKSWSLTNENGEQSTYIKFKDAAGNESLTYSDSITLDTTGPSGSIGITENLDITSSNVISLTLFAQDSTTEVTQMMICNHSNFNNCSWQEYTTTKTWTLSNENGTKTVYVKYRDILDNESSTYSTSIVLDNTGPYGSIKINNRQKSTNSPQVKLTISASDSISSVDKMIVCESSSFNNCNWESYTPLKNWTLSTTNGAKTIYLKLMDSLGNISPVYSNSVTLITPQQPTEDTPPVTPQPSPQQEAKQPITEDEIKEVKELLNRAEETLPTNVRESVTLTANQTEVSSVEEKLHVYKETSIDISIPVETVSQNIEDNDMDTIYAVLGDTVVKLVLNSAGDKYETTFPAGEIEGEHTLYLLTKYKDGNAQKSALTQVTIDPYGYIYYTNIAGNQVRVQNAQVTLYKVENGKEVLYEKESQSNPQTTEVEGEYSFFVEPGTYILKVQANGFKDYQSEEFEVIKNTIQMNIELEKNNTTLIILLSLGTISFLSTGYLLLRRK